MEGFGSYILPICILLILVFSTFLYFISGKTKYSNLPPGPRPYPLLGNLPQLIGKDIQQVFKKYRTQYGNVFTVHMFNKIIIVVNGADELKNIFVKNGSVFSERPHITKLGVPAERIGAVGGGIMFPSGKLWKHNKQFAIHTLREFGMGKKQLQVTIHAEILRLLDVMGEYDGQPFDVRDLLKVTVSNIMGSILYGRRYDYHDDVYLEFLHRMGDSARGTLELKANWLKYIPGDPYKIQRSQDNSKYFIEFFTTNIRKNYDDFDEENMRNLTDVYIKQMKKEANTKETQSFMNENELAWIVHDLFIAGIEATTSALLFGIIYLLRHPDIQKRISNELQAVVPDCRLPDIDHRACLPFVNATVLEILRLSNVAPFSFPHASKMDIEYKGYLIPKSALILPNISSVLWDETTWDEPQIFNPSRFLNGNTTRKVDEFCPFSLGPRACPGEAMAIVEIYLFITAILQRFELLHPEGEDPPSGESVSATIPEPKLFRMRAVKRGNMTELK